MNADLYNKPNKFTALFDFISDCIEIKCNEWKPIVYEYYNNDDVMDDIIEQVEQYQNLLSGFFDIVKSDTSITADDKDDLLTSIAELNEMCEEALER